MDKSKLAAVKFSDLPDFNPTEWMDLADAVFGIVSSVNFKKGFLFQTVDIEDVTQDILLRLFLMSLETKPQTGSFRRYLFRTATNRLIDYIRAARRSKEILVEDYDEKCEGFYIVQPDVAHVRESLKALKKKDRIRLEEYFLEEKKPAKNGVGDKQIANAMYKRRHDVREKFKKALSKALDEPTYSRHETSEGDDHQEAA